MMRKLNLNQLAAENKSEKSTDKTETPEEPKARRNQPRSTKARRTS